MYCVFCFSHLQPRTRSPNRQTAAEKRRPRRARYTLRRQREGNNITGYGHNIRFSSRTPWKRGTSFFFYFFPPCHSFAAVNLYARVFVRFRKILFNISFRIFARSTIRKKNKKENKWKFFLTSVLCNKWRHDLRAYETISPMCIGHIINTAQSTRPALSQNFII